MGGQGAGGGMMGQDTMGDDPSLTMLGGGGGGMMGGGMGGTLQFKLKIWISESSFHNTI